jgi:hypothetical protein
VNVATCNLRRSFAGRMLSDPAWRSLLSRPARRVCHAVKAHRSCDAVRGCALLATDSRDVMLSCRSPYSRTARSHGHALSTQFPPTDSNPYTGCLRRWFLGSPSNILCTWCTIRRLTCATGGRMIALYQSLTLREVPFRLYGSLRAVKVEFPCCPELPPLTVLAPPVGPASMASRWSNPCRKVFET